MNPPCWHILRAKGPAPYQPRATPWVTHHKNHRSPEGAFQPDRHRAMDRPFRANLGVVTKPRAMPWAGMGRTVGAETAREKTPAKSRPRKAAREKMPARKDARAKKDARQKVGCDGGSAYAREVRCGFGAGSRGLALVTSEMAAQCGRARRPSPRSSRWW